MNDLWAMPQAAHDWICEHIPNGTTILELGSGSGTKRLADRGYNVVTVEHDPEFWHKQRHKRIRYVEARIKDGWYEGDPRTWVRVTDPPLRCVVIDGPPGNIGRQGVLPYIEAGVWSGVPLLFDDVHRPAEGALAMDAAKARGESLSVHMLTDGRAFAVVGRM